MGYQALLFCPDEKTARTVTQVLSELDFAVVPCTEPFAAVKQLMGEHFDAIVVDCDNEQNATLLFKSAHNAALNQSSLAVAVVEGQAGVAKAFRIGANLVLTKPINVEQAKGTLRVARGLLRKNEAAKPGPGTSAATKSASSVPPSPQTAAPRPVPSVSIPRPVTPLAAVASASIPPRKPLEHPIVVASVPPASTESDADIFEIGEEVPAASIAPAAAQTATPTSAPKLVSTASSPAAEPRIAKTTDKSASSAGFGTGAASAPAPAREVNTVVSTKDKPSQAISELDHPVEEGAAIDSGSSAAGSSALATAFTFGGNASEAQAASDKKKKALLAVVVVMLIVAVAYAVWMQWVSSSGAATGPTRIVAPVTAPKAVPQATPSAALPDVSSTPSSPGLSASTSVQPSTPDSVTASPATTTAKPTADKPGTAGAGNASAHTVKASTDADSSKPSASAVAANKLLAPKASEQPIVMKSGASQPAASVDAPAPSLTGIAPASDNAMPNLMGGAASAPAPVLQTVNISQGVSQGLLVKKVQPVYPANALRLRLEGPIQLLATISKTGDISAVKVLSGEPQLARAAVAAVKQWKYKPYLLNGSPVEIQTPITVKFTLP